MKKNLLYILLLLLPVFLAGEEYLVPPPDPPRLVNDLAGVLTPEQREMLERKLVAYDDTTSTQIAVLIINDLQGYDKADFAQRVAEQWGIGQKEKDNGVLILVKPKTKHFKGEVFIATAYGVEEFIPDAIAKRIVEQYMIPYFRQGDYYGGINAGIDKIIAYTQGKFDPEKDTPETDYTGLIIFIIFMIILFIIISKGNNSNTSTTGSGRGFTNSGGGWIFMGGGSGGSFGGSGGFGGGGFGGFGGGSFGGGGAGGSW